MGTKHTQALGVRFRGRELRRLRESHGDTPAGLAAVLGIDRSTLVRAELHGVVPCVRALWLIEERYGTPIAQLLAGVDERDDPLPPADVHRIATAPVSDHDPEPAGAA